MNNKIFISAAKICLIVFMGYALLFGIANYVDFYIQYSQPPSLPVGSHYSLRFLFLPLAIPLISGYLYAQKVKKKLFFASYFIIVAILLLLIFWLLYFNFHSHYRSLPHWTEDIKMLDKSLEFLFFSSINYFMFAPLCFSLWIWGKKVRFALLLIVFAIMSIGVGGYELLFSILHKLPRFLGLLIVLLLFPPLSQPPLPFTLVGLVYNLYLLWYLINAKLKTANLRNSQ